MNNQQGPWPFPKPTSEELEAAKLSLDEWLAFVIGKALDALEDGETDV